MSEWISTEDSLPEPFEDVPCQYLAYSIEEDKYYAAKYLGELHGWSIPGVGGLLISHWQPLPPLPEGE